MSSLKGYGRLCCLAAGSVAITGQLWAADKIPTPPNIIMILTDDVGLGDIGCCGGSVPTPHIDKMASEGIRFAQCYSTPLCGPSRCQLLTGRYPFRTGLINNQSHNAVSPDREVMIPTVMKKAGYVTGSCGKWGQICEGPGEWGFDEYLVFPGSGRYWRDQTEAYTVNHVKTNLPKGQYLPDIMHTFVVNFINSHKDQPFFLYYPMSHIHGPIVPTPDSKPGAGRNQLYTDNIAYMDKLVGKLMDELDKLGLRENTLVLFAGDNGTASFGAETATVNGRKISGRKASMLEGGSRVPLIASWKGVMSSGKVVNDLVDFSDFFVTFADLGGAKLPAGVKLDGKSFAAQLKGEKGSPREYVYVELNGKSFVRDSQYKLTNDGHLFDLKNAPFEEIAVGIDTNNAVTTKARTHLQEILNQYPTAEEKKISKRTGKKHKKNKAL